MKKVKIIIVFIIFVLFISLSFAQDRRRVVSGRPTVSPADLDMNKTIKKIQRLEKLVQHIDLFVKGASQYSSIAAEITESYSGFLRAIVDLHSNCEISMKTYEQKKQRTMFGGIYQNANDRCERLVFDLKNESKEYAQDIDTIIETAKQANEAAKFALREKKNARAQKRALELSGVLKNNLIDMRKKGEKLVDQSEKIRKLNNKD